MKKIVVYLSGPITNGDRNANFHQAASWQKSLMQAGFSVINPMLSMLAPFAWEFDHEAWIENDLPIVERCDLILRLPGESKGADAECEHARACGVVVINEEEMAKEITELAIKHLG